jgi:serine/threonine protein kinase
MPEDAVEERARGRIGETLNGKYRLERLLGVGGMASVYAATHRNSKRFAVKMLHPELSVHTSLRARFMREGYVANTVDHPGAVAVLDDDVTDDGSAFLVMELLEGGTLDELCARQGGRLSLRHVLAIAYQLLDVLAAADAKNIVHRDIKPSNVFVTRSGQVKVLDFGVARLRSAQESQATFSGMALGTPAFMPPEQALGRSDDISGRTDVWAVGATMVALLTGRAVHDASSAQEQMVFAATKPAPSLATFEAEAPPTIVAIVDRALAFDQANRWPHAGAMRDAIAVACTELFGEVPSTTSLVALAAEGGSPPSVDAPSDPLAPTLAAPAGLSTRPRARSLQPRPSDTSLAGTSAAPQPAAAGRIRIALGAALLVAVGVGAGAWVTTRRPATQNAASAASESASIGSTRAPDAAAAGEPPVFASSTLPNAAPSSPSAPPAVSAVVAPAAAPRARSTRPVAAPLKPTADKFDRQ